jgi:hypothetical protein
VAKVKNKSLTFRLSKRKARTSLWRVNSKRDRALLGYVGWDTPWRQYCFSPVLNYVFASSCQREIADFCDRMTARQRRGWAAKEKDKSGGAPPRRKAG